VNDRIAALLLAGLALALPACGSTTGGNAEGTTVTDPIADEAAVDAVLDDFHAAASEADGDRYFGHFAPDGVFVGTDASERWTVDAFRAYAEPHFSKGKGWTYTTVERHVRLAPGGDTAWFDERLENASYGATRGSGVLRRIDGAWKIEQYVLSFPIPNDVARDVVERIRAHESGER
jgi:uncharacterized protein (TIGR02246 family)